MNKEVSFSIAKLLKEKGIIFETKLYYSSETKVTSVSYNEFAAPTVAEVVMWLYEKHGIWISVECDVYGKLWYAKFTVASKSLWENEDKRHEVLTSFRKFYNEHDTPTKAYEAAIKHTLNNLI